MLKANLRLPSVSFDRGYDDGARSLTAVSCSDGENGLITTYGWDTQSEVAGFPYIGGVEAVGGWNSPNVRLSLVSLLNPLMRSRLP